MTTEEIVATNDVLSQVFIERMRQESLALGGDTHRFDLSNSRNDWVAYIAAYSGRAAQKVFRNEKEKCGFRENMIKVAALAVAAIEAHDKEWC